MSSVTWHCLHHRELDTATLYELLALRTQVFVVEQNRDGQMRSLLVNEFGIDPARLVAVLHYDGTPITARFIARAIKARLRPESQKEKSA